MLLFVGLGNKGAEYEKTRHNSGFLALDLLAKHLLAPKNEVLKFSSSVFSIDFKGEKIVCIKPQTYMNLSGKAVLEAMRFYKIPISNVFVFHDDIDLECGRLKFKTGGSSGGHNGLKSIDEMVGGEYARIRIGIGRPQFKNDVSNFVLSNFKPEEWSLIEERLERLFADLPSLISKKF
jgi:PTH1 family peptidyl-tRNA hydrolase